MKLYIQLFSVCLLCSCSLDLESPSDTSVSAKGYVKDLSTKQPIPNVQVAISIVYCGWSDFGLDYAKETVSDENGFFEVSYSDPDYYGSENVHCVDKLSFDPQDSVHLSISLGIEMGDHVSKTFYIDHK